MKKLAVIFFSLSILLAGCTSTSSPDSPASEEIQDMVDQAQAEYEKSLQELEDARDAFHNPSANSGFVVPDEEYIEVSALQLYETLDENPVKAELSYLDKFVKLTGRTLLDGSIYLTHDITSDFRISGKLVNGAYDDVLNAVTKSELLTIWGKVIDINGESKYDMKYDIEVYKLEGEPKLNPDEIDYMDVTVSSIIDAFDENALDAQERYLGKYITFPAVVKSIWPDRVSFDDDIRTNDGRDIIATTDGYIDGDITNDNIKLKIAELSEEDHVTVWGKVIDANTFYGITSYSINIIDIQQE